MFTLRIWVSGCLLCLAALSAGCADDGAASIAAGAGVAAGLAVIAGASSSGDPDEPTQVASGGPFTNPDAYQCVGRNAYSGLPTPAFETFNPAMTAGFAVTSFDQNGNPLIVYGAQYLAAPPLIRMFIKRHECAHANGYFNEIDANCVALQSMRSEGLGRQDEEAIASWHFAMGPVGAQYGGTGTEFWSWTLACAGPLTLAQDRHQPGDFSRGAWKA